MKIKSHYFKRQYDLHKAELIGEGNFAQVYKIFDNEQNDAVAIRKVKKSQADLEDINKQKLINEELRKVDNQNILKIYDIIDQQQTVWYITEYCSGGSLWDALNQCKDNKMSEKQALQCILQISKGVQELHNHRITHRDLKPQNILLKTKYIVGKPLPLIKLADFGLSTQKIIMETIAGTKEYIAPEQAKFHNYTNAVDVWSLGIIFDQILHGNPFYSGEDNKEVFNKILKMPFKIRDQNIRGSIKQLLVTLLKKKPYQRPIIAVIRSTIEKILQQIENENVQKNAENQVQKNKKSKSSNQSKAGTDFTKNVSTVDPKVSSAHSSSKQNLLVVESRKVYESNSIENQQPPQQKLQKTWKSNIAPDKTPTAKNKPNLVKEELDNVAKNQSVLVKQEPKVEPKMEPKTDAKDRIVSTNYKDRIAKNKSIVDELFDGDKRQEKPPRMPPTKVQIQPPKIQVPKVQIQPKNNPSVPINDKISIYKTERKKVVVSTVKKQEYKQQILDINSYKTRIFNNKRSVLEKQLKLQKIIAFLPNTFLSVGQFQQIRGNTQQALTGFKKHLNFLNYYSDSEDYEIRLIKGENQMQSHKQSCLNELKSMQLSIKKVFLQQMDNYVDQYIEKILK